MVKNDGRGAIAASLPPILERLKLNNENWFDNITQFEKVYAKRFARKRRSRQAA